MIVYISMSQVLKLVESLSHFFNTQYIVRDKGLLESAISQPYATFGGDDLNTSFAEKASCYLYYIISNHTLNDGNKRLGLLTFMTFLKINNRNLKATHSDLESLALNVASGKMNKDSIIEWVTDHIQLHLTKTDN